MANISLEKPSEQMYSKAVDCVVDYLKNKELKINGGCQIESMGYSDWLKVVNTSVYFIFNDDLLVGFVEFKKHVNSTIGACFSIRPSERLKSYYPDIISSFIEKVKGADYTSLLVSCPDCDTDFMSYAKTNLIFETSEHLLDGDIAYFRLQLV